MWPGVKSRDHRKIWAKAKVMEFGQCERLRVISEGWRCGSGDKAQV
jgi:hypothetical protein